MLQQTFIFIAVTTETSFYTDFFFLKSQLVFPSFDLYLGGTSSWVSSDYLLL